MAKFVPQAEMPLSDQVKVRRDKLEALRAEGLDPFQQTKFDVTSSAKEIKENFDAMEGRTVTLAGRLMSKRGMGKVSFCDLQDNTVKLQVAFGGEEPELPASLNVLHHERIGRVHTYIVRGNQNDILAQVSALQPILLEAIPLTLEEIFIYEMGGADYAVHDIVL